MKKFLFLLFFIPFFNYSQDLFIQYFDEDQKDDKIKTVWISDERGTIKEKSFPAKSHIHLIKIFEKKGYKVKNIKVTVEPKELHKYHIWFDKVTKG